MKKTLQTNIAINDLYELACVRPTQSSDIQTFSAMLVCSVFFSILPKCLFVISLMYAHFIDISQDSVETHLRWW